MERLIRAPMDALWGHTQEPALHQRWDLRFTDIDYLPRSDAADPQRFRYATRLGFGVAVSGEGETVGERDQDDGGRVSALRFWSDQARSLIREGRGYWRYIPTDDGVRFLTSYDYETRYGLFGRLVDRLAFRPLIGWATAWSFDRLRLWLEDGIDPGVAARQALAHAVARAGLVFVFAFHGLVPKLLGPHPDEVRLMAATGIPDGLVGGAIVALGVAQLLLAIWLIAGLHRAGPAIIGGAFAIGASIGIVMTSPEELVAAFGPVSLNVAVLALAAVDLLTLDGIPSAGRCLRRPEAGRP